MLTRTSVLDTVLNLLPSELAVWSHFHSAIAMKVKFIFYDVLKSFIKVWCFYLFAVPFFYHRQWNIFEILFYWKEVIHVIMLPPPPSSPLSTSKKKKKKRKKKEMTQKKIKKKKKTIEWINKLINKNFQRRIQESYHIWRYLGSLRSLMTRIKTEAING